ncbi:MAG: hypothetical protein ACTSVL_10715 [Promethearchaeota archaeon]
MRKVKDFIAPSIFTAGGILLKILRDTMNLNYQLSFISLILIIIGIYLFIDPIFDLTKSVYENFSLDIHKCQYCGYKYTLTGADTQICPKCLKRDPNYQKPVISEMV